MPIYRDPKSTLLLILQSQMSLLLFPKCNWQRTLKMFFPVTTSLIIFLEAMFTWSCALRITIFIEISGHFRKHIKWTILSDNMFIIFSSLQLLDANYRISSIDSEL